MEETHNVRGAETIPLDKPKEIKKLPRSTIQVTPQTSNSHVEVLPKKQNVFILWLISTITLGIYTGVWYLKRSPEFDNLGTIKKLNKTFPIIALTLNILLLIITIAIPLTIASTEMGAFYQNLSPLQTTLIIGFFALIFFTTLFYLILSFISKSVINQALRQKSSDGKISWLFTLIFGHYYLQYEINRILEDQEEKPKKAPLIIFIIILMLGVLSALAGIFL